MPLEAFRRALLRLLQVRKQRPTKKAQLPPSTLHVMLPPQLGRDLRQCLHLHSRGPALMVLIVVHIAIVVFPFIIFCRHRTLRRRRDATSASTGLHGLLSDTTDNCATWWRWNDVMPFLDVFL